MTHKKFITKAIKIIILKKLKIMFLEQKAEKMRKRAKALFLRELRNPKMKNGLRKSLDQSKVNCQKIKNFFPKHSPHLLFSSVKKISAVC